jgi:hypothetical protein
MPNNDGMQKISLTALARQQVDRAAGAGGGHTADTVYGGHEKSTGSSWSTRCVEVRRLDPGRHQAVRPGGHPRAPPGLRYGCPTTTPPRCRPSTAGQIGGRGRSPAAGFCTGARRARTQGRRCAHRRHRGAPTARRQPAAVAPRILPMQTQYGCASPPSAGDRVAHASPTPQWTGPLLRWTMGPVRTADEGGGSFVTTVTIRSSRRDSCTWLCRTRSAPVRQRPEDRHPVSAHPRLRGRLEHGRQAGPQGRGQA